MDSLEIPEYFICPISLQIMKDPVTTLTGITYDRESIERWQLTANANDLGPICPVTKQMLARDSDLTPNHTLRRLIQAWCIANSKAGIDPIPSPEYPVHKSVVSKLIRDVNSDDLLLQIIALEKLDKLACGSAERNRKRMEEAGVPKEMVLFILKKFKEDQITGVEEASRVLRFTRIPSPDVLQDNFDFAKSILWILKTGIGKEHALAILRSMVEESSSNFIERLSNLDDFFTEMVKVLRENKNPHSVISVLHVLTKSSSSGLNKTKIVESGAVFELIELELRNSNKKTAELILGLLASLCCCAEGRQKFLEHAGGVAVVAKRTLRISPATDEYALSVLESIARFSATPDVVLELLRVGAVSKLCMVLQANCAAILKNKARGILRLHHRAWHNSPCIQVYLLTRYP